MQHEPNARVPAGPDPAIRALLSRDDEEAERAAQQNERLAGLLLRTAERDQQAFAAFYDETFKQAFAVARRIVLSTESAEDVLEDAYFQVWREAARFDGGRGRALTWLLMMVRSRALDHLRRRDPVQSLEQTEHRLGSSDGGEYIDTQAVHEGYPGNPHDLLDATRRESAIHTALAALRPVERQIIALAYFRDLSHQEIATTCRMPLGSVKTIIHRAHGKLRTILAAHGIEA
jgi:RNA polymerase sigma factor (sigma-70 family)